MNKHQVQIAKIENTGKIIEGIFHSIHMFLVMGTVILCVFLMTQALENLVANDATKLDSLAKVVEHLGLAQITGYIIGALGFGYGVYQNRTVKKLESALNSDK